MARTSILKFIAANGASGSLSSSCSATPALSVSFPTATTVTDSSTAANAITVSINAYTWSTQPQGVFSQAQQYITVTATTTIYMNTVLSATTSGTWTISVWFLAPFVQTGGWQTLVRGSTGDHHILIDASGYLGTYDNLAGTGFYSTTFNMFTAYTTAQWHHLTATATGSQRSGSTTFYIDGNTVGTGTVAFSAIGNVYTLFTYNVPGSQAFQSAGIYRLRVYNTAFSQACVQNQMYWDMGAFGVSLMTMMKLCMIVCSSGYYSTSGASSCTGQN